MFTRIYIAQDKILFRYLLYNYYKLIYQHNPLQVSSPKVQSFVNIQSNPQRLKEYDFSNDSKLVKPTEICEVVIEISYFGDNTLKTFFLNPGVFEGLKCLGYDFPA